MTETADTQRAERTRRPLFTAAQSCDPRCRGGVDDRAVSVSMFERQRRVSSLERSLSARSIVRDQGKKRRAAKKTHPGGGAKPGGGGIKPGGGGIPIGGMPGMPGGGANDCGACRLNVGEKSSQLIAAQLSDWGQYEEVVAGKEGMVGHREKKRELTLSAEQRVPFLVPPEHQTRVPEQAESERRVSVVQETRSHFTTPLNDGRLTAARPFSSDAGGGPSTKGKCERQ